MVVLEMEMEIGDWRLELRVWRLEWGGEGNGWDGMEGSRRGFLPLSRDFSGGG